MKREAGFTEFRILNIKISIVRGDIAEQSTDAIVNAANNSLMGGGGVDGAIHRKGGPTILEECKRIRENEWPNGLPTGKAVITKGGNLKARYVIHTVGPVWHGGDQGEPELLAKAYRNSIDLAVSKGLRSVAFPSISTGTYNYPIEKAARTALETVAETLRGQRVLEEVIFTLFSGAALNTYIETARELFSTSLTF
ncbi:MAG: O-acetyl-ADP-ribose deacetylase [Candidatus Bathyarchaeota archaeon]|nr:O-acetyl-ADP-ribose deacetylase [Candidatus Bathyarchaeota archaeon]